MKHSRIVSSTLILTLVILGHAPALRAQQPVPPTLFSHAYDPAVVLDGPELLETRKLEKARLAKWQQRLAQLAAREHADLFYDVPDVGDPPTVDYSGKRGETAMKALAVGTERTWKQVHGVQTFSRVGVGILRNDVGSIIEWLASLNEAEFANVAAGNLYLADLDPPIQKLFDTVISANADMSFVFLDNDDSTRIRLRPKLVMRSTDTGNGSGRLDFKPYSHFRPAGSAPEQEPPKRAGHSAVTVLEVPIKGALDFGTGELLTLNQITQRAAKAFGVKYEVDGRIARTNYFVTGSYSKEALDSALELVTVVPGVAPRKPARDLSSDIARVKALYSRVGPKNIDVAGLRYEMRITDSRQLDALTAKYGASEILNTSPFYTQQSAKASELAGEMPGFAHYLQTNGITADSALSLDFTLVLEVTCPGTHFSSIASFVIGDDKAKPAVMGNTATMQLWAP